MAFVLGLGSCQHNVTQNANCKMQFMQKATATAFETQLKFE